MRLDPFTGRASEHGTFEWDASHQVRQTLSVAQDGAILLVTSGSDATSRVATVHLDENKQATFTTFDTFEFAQEAAPFASSDEVSFLSVDAMGRTTGVRRVAALKPVTEPILSGFFR